MKGFKYDLIQLIEGVRDRPCLWDKSLDNYKDRLERRAAWEEIFVLLEQGYDEMSPEAKRITGEHILTKWTNVRDTFIKTLRRKSGRPKRKYLFYEHLKFLTKNKQDQHNTDIFNETDENPAEYSMKQEPEDERISPVVSCKSKKSIDYDEDYRPSKKANTSRTRDSDHSFSNEIDFVQCDDDETKTDPRIMNEDEAFFASLLPTVAKYNEDERLHFRIGVLGVMKKVKQNKGWNDD